MSYLGIDIGTSGVRCVAVNSDGHSIAEAETGVALQIQDGDVAEVEASSVWHAVTDVLRAVGTSPGVRRDPAEAISFSVQGEAMVPIDGSGRPLAGVPVSFDMRASATTAQLADHIGSDRLQQITGQPVHPMFSIGKMMVVHQRLDGSRIRGWRCLGDFVAERLGGEAAMDTTVAARTMAFDVDHRHWSDEILAAAGISEELLPSVVDATEQVGQMSSRTADALGLRSRPVLVAGAHDQACAYWGAGCADPGEVVVSLGSSEAVTTASAVRVEATHKSGIATYPAGATWLMLAGVPVGGLALEWLRRLGDDKQLPYEELLRGATSGPSDLLVFPYMAGGATIDNDPEARGSIIGLTLNTGKADIARGLLEASGYEIRRVVDWLVANDVAHTGTLRAVGGGARHEGALQVRADSSGLAIQYVVRHAAVRGAALLAAAGTEPGSFRDIVKHMAATPGRVHVPNPSFQELYAQRRVAYQAHIETLRSIRRDTDTGAT